MCTVSSLLTVLGYDSTVNTHLSAYFSDTLNGTQASDIPTAILTHVLGDARMRQLEGVPAIAGLDQAITGSRSR